MESRISKNLKNKLPRLQISTNGHYLETSDGTPFFWLADTAWTLIGHLKREEAAFYMDNRREKGFTVLQIVALDPETNPDMTDSYGNSALIEMDVTKPNEVYWKYLDELICMAAERGMYVLLLPAWGELIVGDDWFDGIFPKLITKENAELYGYWIGKRYSSYTNIIWCLGGDRHPIHRGVDYRMVWRLLAQGIGRGVTGEPLLWNRESKTWKTVLMTYHPTISDDPDAFSSSYYFPDEPWMSFNMLQSGHRENVKNYAAVYEEYHKVFPKPIWDGEANYEDWKITTMPNEEIRYHDAWNVRKRAYWSLFAGAFGYTYGNACVWCMVDEERKDGDILKYTWQEALDRPGAVQMKYVRRLLDCPDFFNAAPCQEMLGRLDNYLDIRKACLRSTDGKKVFIYYTSGGSSPVELAYMNGRLIKAQWYNPRDGEYYNEKNEHSDAYVVYENVGQRITCITPTGGRGLDWILVLSVMEVEK